METNSAKKAKNNWRFESKFALNITEEMQFEKLILRSDLEILHPDRQINNCYFDDTSNSAHTDSLEGYGERQKTRIRWYGSLYGEKTPNLEFKIKHNNSNIKESFKLFPVNISSELDWNDYLNIVREYLINKEKFFLSQNLHPVLINSYTRKYYSNPKKTFRLTIDHDLLFLSPNTYSKVSIPMKLSVCVVELKSDNKLIISDFPWINNLGKFSKYSIGRLSLL